MSQGLLQALLRARRRPLHVLALGPHVDDPELGGAATLMHLRVVYKAVIHYVIFSDHFRERADRPQINRGLEAKNAAALLGCHSVKLLTYEDTQFPNHWRQIQGRVEDMLRHHKNTWGRPYDLVLAPHVNDNHQDHIVVAQAAVREAPFHASTLWHYEIKQFGQDTFDPTIFVDASGTYDLGWWESSVKRRYRQFLKCFSSPKPWGRRWIAQTLKDCLAYRKAFILQDCMRSQKGKRYLHPELVLGTMRRRGMQASPQTSYAEAFVGRITL